MKKYLPRLIDDLLGNLLQVLPFCFGGDKRINHKLELSPRAHYIIKHIKNEVMRSLKEENVFMNYRWLSRSIVILALEFTCKLNKYNQGKVEEEEESKTKQNESKDTNINKSLPLLLETMEERRRVHRCHSQHMPLSLTYMNHHLT